MHRRSFIAGYLFGAGVLVTKPSLLFAKSGKDHKKLIEILEKFATDSSRLGQVYKVKYPSDNNTNVLVDKIFDGWNDSRVNSSNDNIELYLRNQIRNDYEQENYLEVDGWIVSLTEARINLILTQ